MSPLFLLSLFSFATSPPYIAVFGAIDRRANTGAVDNLFWMLTDDIGIAVGRDAAAPLQPVAREAEVA